MQILGSGTQNLGSIVPIQILTSLKEMMTKPEADLRSLFPFEPIELGKGLSDFTESTYMRKPTTGAHRVTNIREKVPPIMLNVQTRRAQCSMINGRAELTIEEEEALRAGGLLANTAFGQEIVKAMKTAENDYIFAQLMAPVNSASDSNLVWDWNRPDNREAFTIDVTDRSGQTTGVENKPRDIQLVRYDTGANIAGAMGTGLTYDKLTSAINQLIKFYIFPPYVCLASFDQIRYLTAMDRDNRSWSEVYTPLIAQGIQIPGVGGLVPMQNIPSEAQLRPTVADAAHTARVDIAYVIGHKDALRNKRAMYPNTVEGDSISIDGFKLHIGTDQETGAIKYYSIFSKVGSMRLKEWAICKIECAYIADKTKEVTFEPQ